MNETEGQRNGLVDWQAAYLQIESARLAAEHQGTLSADDEARLLAARAAALASGRNSPMAAEHRQDWLLFRMSGESYGVESVFVREVSRPTPLTSLPGTPPFVLGIVNLHGEIMSVLDLGLWSGLPAATCSGEERIIFLESGSMVFGILVECLLGTFPLPDSAIQSVSAPRSRHLKGVTRDGATLLDAEALLADDTIVVRDNS
ncbi:chemotaxis protein CheW [Paludibacterium paludis]|uniref:CheW-like domain-containing protein n=1 Tax=Paludibacterium paludis TaxID=1225769 RepID=A0A918P4N0_9NEIS|nr:chemotaxis protein CheW [Paludibacterium paludis]GGY22261.1 hypothetical protein GCM10011289_27420 [Paludibacterium paludis]